MISCHETRTMIFGLKKVHHINLWEILGDNKTHDVFGLNGVRTKAV